MERAGSQPAPASSEDHRAASTVTPSSDAPVRSRLTTPSIETAAVTAPERAVTRTGKEYR